MKITLKELNKLIKKAMKHPNLGPKGKAGLETFLDSLVDFPMDAQFELHDVLALIAADAAEGE